LSRFKFDARIYVQQRTEPVLTDVYASTGSQPAPMRDLTHHSNHLGITMKLTVIAALLAVATLSACTKTEKTTTVVPDATPTVIEKTVAVPVPVAVPGPAGPAGEAGAPGAPGMTGDKGDMGATGKQGDTVVVVPDAAPPAPEPAR